LRKVGSMPNGADDDDMSEDDEKQAAVPYEDDLDEAKPAIPTKKRKLENVCILPPHHMFQVIIILILLSFLARL